MANKLNIQIYNIHKMVSLLFVNNKTLIFKFKYQQINLKPIFGLLKNIQLFNLLEKAIIVSL